VANGAEKVWPNGDPVTPPNELDENGVAGDGTTPPKTEPPKEPMDGLIDETRLPVPKALPAVELNGVQVAGGRFKVDSSEDLLSPPTIPEFDSMFGVDAVADVDFEVVLEDTGAGAKMDFFSPPPSDDLSEAVVCWISNEEPAEFDEDAMGASLSSNGLVVWYFFASLSNKYLSLPCFHCTNEDG
jgi:hypothetical protein